MHFKLADVLPFLYKNFKLYFLTGKHKNLPVTYVASVIARERLGGRVSNIHFSNNDEALPEIFRIWLGVKMQMIGT